MRVLLLFVGALYAMPVVGLLIFALPIPNSIGMAFITIPALLLALACAAFAYENLRQLLDRE